MEFEFLSNLGLVGQFVGLLALGICTIIIVAYTWIYLKAWLKDKGIIE